MRDSGNLVSLDGGNVVVEFSDPDGSGEQSMALSKRYLYGEVVDQILAQEDVTKDISATDRVLWPLVDSLGTVRDLAKQDGTIATHFTCDSYGNVVSGDTSLTRYLFTSREWDTATELQYNRARWYDPAVGRWLSEDPLGFVAGDANVNRNVRNSVIEGRDPSGLWWWDDDWIELGLGGLVGLQGEEVQAEAGQAVIDHPLSEIGLGAATGAVAGAGTGAVGGAVVGSVVPGPGTAAGAITGAGGGFIVGAITGGIAAGVASEDPIDAAIDGAAVGAAAGAVAGVFTAVAPSGGVLAIVIGENMTPSGMVPVTLGSALAEMPGVVLITFPYLIGTGIIAMVTAYPVATTVTLEGIVDWLDPAPPMNPVGMALEIAEELLSGDE